MRLKYTVCCLAVLLTSSFVSNAYTAANPVTDFIAGADSAAIAGGDDALSRFVSENAILVGAAVGHLLDSAIEQGDDGQVEAEKESTAFAEQIAMSYKQHTGSEAPLRLVRLYRSWDENQRALRSNAKDLEEQAIRAQQSRNYQTAIEQPRRSTKRFKMNARLRAYGASLAWSIGMPVISKRCVNTTSVLSLPGAPSRIASGKAEC
jgi:hypothetical protein